MNCTIKQNILKILGLINKRVKEHFEDLKGILEIKKIDSLKEIEK